MLVVQQVVQDLDGCLAGGVDVLDQLQSAATDRHGGLRGAGTEFRPQDIQTRMDHIQRGTDETYKKITIVSSLMEMIIVPDLMRYMAHKDLLQVQ